MKKWIVIGGSGFVGVRLMERLEGEVETVNIDLAASSRFPDRTHRADIRNPTEYEPLLEGAEGVVLLAAEHRDNVEPRQKYYDVNVRGAELALAAMDAAGVKRLVFTSSVAVYGLNRAESPSEESRLEPFNDYGKSKAEAEGIIRKWVAQGEGRAALVLRPTVIFGEGNRGNVYKLLRQIVSGRFLMIGSGTNRKSMAYVGNVVEFLRSKMAGGFAGLEVFNCVDEPAMSMQELVKLVCDFRGKAPPKVRIPLWLGLLGGRVFDLAARVLGRQFSVSRVRVEKFAATTLFSGAKITASGFVPPTTLDEALRRTLAAEFGSEACPADREDP